jgi:hypothetical protein
MAEQNKVVAENTFWNGWLALKSNVANNAGKNDDQHEHEPIRRMANEYADRVAQHQAEASRKENLKLIAMVVTGILAICLIVFLLSLINVEPDASTAKNGDSSQKSTSLSKEEEAEKIETSIKEDMAKGGFTTKEAYFSSELTKQSNDVGKELVEFSKRIKSVSPKMNITSLVIAKKMDQFKKDKTINGFGIELVEMGDESDDVKLISHLNGMTSPVEFYAEDGRVVAHFKNYPPSYCAGTKGAAVCGS